MSQIKQNLEIINQKILDAEQKAGRPQGSVKLMAVSKFHPVDAVIEALKAGQTLFGENRVQEAYQKFTELYKKYPELELHIIGQLQTNKVKKAVEIASVIESVVPGICWITRTAWTGWTNGTARGFTPRPCPAG